MATQLNIKDAETVRAVRQYAAETGRSVTATVREAIAADRARREADLGERRRELDDLLADIRAYMPEDVKRMTSKEIMDSIYDDSEPDGFAR